MNRRPVSLADPDYRKMLFGFSTRFGTPPAPTASPSAPLEGTLAASALWNFFNRGVISAVRVASVVMARPLLIFPSGASDPSP